MATTLVTKAIEQIYGQLSGKQQANELYRVLVPELKEAVERGDSLDTPQVIRLIEAICKLPPGGARRRNFVRKYMEDRDSMLRLPNDPNNIMFGYWW